MHSFLFVSASSSPLLRVTSTVNCNSVDVQDVYSFTAQEQAVSQVYLCCFLSVSPALLVTGGLRVGAGSKRLRLWD